MLVVFLDLGFRLRQRSDSAVRCRVVRLLCWWEGLRCWSTEED